MGKSRSFEQMEFSLNDAHYAPGSESGIGSIQAITKWKTGTTGATYGKDLVNCFNTGA
jgi:hypothetical protein